MVSRLILSPDWPSYRDVMRVRLKADTTDEAASAQYQGTFAAPAWYNALNNTLNVPYA